MNKAILVFFISLITGCSSTQKLRETTVEPSNCKYINMVWGLGKTDQEAKLNMQKQALTLEGNVVYLGWPVYFREHQEEKSLLEMAANMVPDHHPELNLNYISYGAVFKCQ